MLCTLAACSQQPNRLTREQKADGWKLLWDGKTTNGWRSAYGEAFPEKGWTIAKGVLEVNANGGQESLGGGDIITTEQYENFWLSVDFKLTPGANSGIKYFVRPDLYQVKDASAIGCEFQVLDDELHPENGAIMKNDLGQGDPILGLKTGGASVRNPYMVIKVTSMMR